MMYEEFRMRFRLYTDNRGEPQVKVFVPGSGIGKYWRSDGKLSFLQVLADDPDCPLTQIGDGAYVEPKT